MANKIPPFLKVADDTAYFQGKGELIYYIPDRYFSDSKNPIAMVSGEYVSVIGIFDWAFIDENGKVGQAHPFKWPTILMCKPNRIEKVKGVSVNGTEERDYRILHFKEGDEAISDINIPKIVDNVEALFRMSIMTENKLPPTVPYDKLHEYFPENMELNAGGYGLSMQLFGIMVSRLCRDKSDPSREFRHSKAFRDNDMTNYKQISVIEVPKFISPSVALASQNWDESLMSAIQMSADGNKTISPLERIVTG
jgi:hypothetical protein